MKKFLVLSLLLVALSGCGLIEEATTGLQYTEDVTAFISDAEEFSNDLPNLIEQAQNDVISFADVEERLQEFQTEIEEVQALNPPELAESIHNDLMNYTDQLETGVNEMIQAAQDQVINMEALENSSLFQAIQQIQQIQENINQLGG
ncbi:DUF6376 family protein [Halobacillus shinanisalinarum]|uniref:DUF6376 family protein n=1 Tax=Halobacillus shinanisalinarum TaxID=2932258 RepID=A0ABY4H4T6_9BACI|nr:DUF6376 family protein [Halobacillus shinanisalinarum]UOQ95226.1 DUF6376 family protein [Halobacillus shinanisalinarum]